MYENKFMEKIQEIEKLSEVIAQQKASQTELTFLKNELKSKIQNCCLYISQLKEQNSYSISVEVVQLLLMLNNKYEYEKLFESMIDFQLLFIYIKAFFAQKNWNLKNLSEDLEQFSSAIKKVFNLSKENIFETQSLFFPNEKCLIGKKNYHLISYSILYCETLMQHTAVLSQLGQHEQALQTVKTCFLFFKKFFKSLQQIFKVIIQVGFENLCNLQFSSQDNFKKCVQYINFVQKIEFPNLDYDHINDEKSLSNQKLSSFGLENFLKTIENDNLNNSLSDKFNKDWMLELHISNIVKLNSTKEFMERLEMIVFDENVVIKSILIFSCCIFSMAAENRFISHIKISQKEKELNKLQQEQNKSQINQPNKLLDNYSKELNLQKSQRFNYSKLIHSKALECLAFGMDKSSNLFTHFLQSFKKNYNFNMFMIKEEEEPSMTTFKNSEYFQNIFISKEGMENQEIQNNWNKIQKKINFQKAKKLGQKVIQVKYDKSFGSGENKSNIFSIKKKLDIMKKRMKSKMNDSKKVIPKNAFIKKSLSNIKRNQNKLSSTEFQNSKLTEFKNHLLQYKTNSKREMKLKKGNLKNKSRDFSKRKKMSFTKSPNLKLNPNPKKKSSKYLLDVKVTGLLDHIKHKIDKCVKTNQKHQNRINMKIDHFYINSYVTTNTPNVN